MADLLELVLPIIDSEGRATPYFEDYLFRIVESIGGEGSTSLDDLPLLASDIGAIIQRLGSGIPVTIDTTGFTIDTTEQTTDMTGM